MPTSAMPRMTIVMTISMMVIPRCLTLDCTLGGSEPVREKSLARQAPTGRKFFLRIAVPRIGKTCRRNADRHDRIVVQTNAHTSGDIDRIGRSPIDNSANHEITECVEFNMQGFVVSGHVVGIRWSAATGKDINIGTQEARWECRCHRADQIAGAVFEADHKVVATRLQCYHNILMTDGALLRHSQNRDDLFARGNKVERVRTNEPTRRHSANDSDHHDGDDQLYDRETRIGEATSHYMKPCNRLQQQT